MNLDVVAKKLTGLAAEIEAEKGPLDLFALFLRDNSYGLWDFVIAASWLDHSPLSSYDYVANHLRKVLTHKEMTGLFRIVILEHGSDVLRSILEYFVNHPGLDNHVHYEIVSGAIIERSYVMVARPPDGSFSGPKEQEATQDEACLAGQVPVDTGDPSVMLKKSRA